MIAFQDAKDGLVSLFGLSKDALHIHVGLVLFFALHWLFRCRLGSLLPLAVLLAICVIGELFDIAYLVQREQQQRWLENLTDIWNTMFWPVLITVYGRWGRPQA